MVARVLRKGWVAPVPVRRRMRPALWTDARSTVAEAAGLLEATDHSCVLVALPDGLGIVTDHDFRSSLANPRSSPAAPVATIASCPAVTVPAETDTFEALLEMVERGIHHLVVTTDTAEPVGVVRAVDLASTEVRDPLLVRRLIRQAADVTQLREVAALLPSAAFELAELDTPALRVTALLSALRDLLVRRVLELRGDDRPYEVSWLLLGSSARREALPGSDIDTALAWSAAHEMHADAMRTDAEGVLRELEACGLPRCPDGANATEPLFSRSVADWTAATRQWAAHPESDTALLLASIVADNRAISHVELGRSLTGSMLAAARTRQFLDGLLTFTLDVRPPRGVTHRARFDLKRGGLWPVVLLGRWLGLATGDTNGSTVDRIRRGGAMGLLTTGETDDLVAAYELVFQLRFDQEVAALRAGASPTHQVVRGQLDTLPLKYVRDSLRAVSAIQGSIRRSWRSRATSFLDVR